MDDITSKQGHLADRDSSCSLLSYYRRLYQDCVILITDAKVENVSNHIYFIPSTTPSKRGSVF